MEASVLLHSGKLISPNESTNKKNNMGKICASGKEIYSSKSNPGRDICTKELY